MSFVHILKGQARKRYGHLKKTLEAIHNIHVDVMRESVNIDELIPTQPKVYADELDGRIYELKKGLAEPIVVIRKTNKLILVDGHHRVIAAKKTRDKKHGCLCHPDKR